MPQHALKTRLGALAEDLRPRMPGHTGCDGGLAYGIRCGTRQPHPTSPIDDVRAALPIQGVITAPAIDEVGTTTTKDAVTRAVIGRLLRTSPYRFNLQPLALGGSGAEKWGALEA
eukprot:scaffold1954_cov364-Prasinococcus_capsulatus_cf.AAC.18